MPTAAATDLDATQTQTPPQAPAVPPTPPAAPANPAAYDPSNPTPYVAPEPPKAPDVPKPTTPDDSSNPNRSLVFGGGTKGAIGTVATLADSILKGAMKGREMAQQKQMVRASRMLSGVQSTKDVLDAQVIDLAQRADIKPLLQKQIANPKYQFTPDEQKTLQPYNEALNRSNTLNSIVGQMEKNYLLGSEKPKKGKGKKDTEQPDMSALMNPNATPAEKLSAAMALREKAGNIVDYKVRAILSQPTPAQDPAKMISDMQAEKIQLEAKPNPTNEDGAKITDLDNRIRAAQGEMSAPKPVSEKPTSKPFQRDGKWYQSVIDSEGHIKEEPMPEGYKPPTASGKTITKVLNVKGKGWSDVTYTPDGTVMSIMPGAAPPRSQIATEHDTTTKDPFGVTTTSHGVTQPIYHSEVDLQTGQKIPQSAEEVVTSAPEIKHEEPPQAQTQPPPTAASTLSEAPSGEAPPAHPAASEAHKAGANKHPQSPKVPNEGAKAPPTPPSAPKPLDESGHIPANAPGVNPGLREAANRLLDGMDIAKLTIPQKDRPAAEAVARQYGWKGQGLFTPRDEILLRESESSLKQAVDSPLLSVLDNVGSRWKLSHMLEKDSTGLLSYLAPNKSLWPLSKQEQDFIIMYNNLADRISGLSQLTRSGRPTEATINRFMKALPNPDLIHSGKAAKETLNNLLNEIDVARDKSSFNANAPKAPKVPSPSAPSVPNFSIAAPDGQTYSFDSQAALDKFKHDAGIK